MSEAFRIVAEGAAPDGFQIADEREHLLWGIVNAFDAQVRRLDRSIDKLTPEMRDLERAQDGTEVKARELELTTDRARNLGDRRDAFETMRDAAGRRVSQPRPASMWRPAARVSHASQTGKLTSAAIDARDYQPRPQGSQDTAAHLPAGDPGRHRGRQGHRQPGSGDRRASTRARAKYADMVHRAWRRSRRREASRRSWAERNGVHQIVCKPDNKRQEMTGVRWRCQECYKTIG